ncbi:MAG TPA: hypothetical protein VHC70_15060 [Phycisphaerales bacterium]|nr:hypothetical protein [Phycisphaerales bacterium]
MGSWSLHEVEQDQPSAEAERFVWPPAAPGRDAGERAPTGSNGPAIKPPDIAGAPNPAAQSATARPAKRNTWPEAWSQIEREWLDVVSPPLAERMLEAGWRPDTPADYCPRCGVSVGRDELIDDLCRACGGGQTPRPPWERIVRIGEFTPPLSDWIREVKFTRWRRLGLDLGRLLGEALAPEIEAARAAGTVPAGPPLIVPVPMPLVRRLVRGIDHAAAIARGVRDRIGGEIVQPLRRDLRPSQTHVAPSRRADNVANAFHLRPEWVRPRLAGRLVVVVDDVSTTTSTLRGACRGVAACIRREREGGGGTAGAAIWAAVLARTPLDGSDAGMDGDA